MFVGNTLNVYYGNPQETTQNDFKADTVRLWNDVSDFHRNDYSARSYIFKVTTIWFDCCVCALTFMLKA